MPTYEYACKACDHRFDIVQSFAEDALTTCPDCEQEALRKVYNAAGIIFKGDGWHIKDYANSGSAPTASASGTAKDGDSSTSSASSSTSSSSQSSTAAAPGKSKKKGAAGDANGRAANRPAAR